MNHNKHKPKAVNVATYDTNAISSIVQSNLARGSIRTSDEPLFTYCPKVISLESSSMNYLQPQVDSCGLSLIGASTTDLPTLVISSSNSNKFRTSLCISGNTSRNSKAICAASGRATSSSASSAA